MKILWLCVARGGSKGVIRKNLREIGGSSLIRWKTSGAYDAGADRVVLSTEDHEIAVEGRACGCTVLMRPAELATDTASTADVIKHALESLWVVGGAQYTHVMLLEPSAPFTRAAQYTQAIAMAETRGADLVLGMRVSEPSSVFVDWMSGNAATDGEINSLCRRIYALRDSRRQAVPQDWTASGGLYMFKVDMFLRCGSVYGGDVNHGLLMDRWSGLEIDTMDDLALAEFAYERGLVR